MEQQSGLRRGGDFILVAGRPKSGVTMATLHKARSFALEGRKVLIFHDENISLRKVQAVGEVEPGDVVIGRSVGSIKECLEYIRPTPEEKGYDVVILDVTHLLPRAYQEYDALAQYIRTFCSETGITVLLTQHVNRTSMKESEQTLASLQTSWMMAQLADQVFLKKKDQDELEVLKDR